MLITTFEEACEIRGIDPQSFERGFDFLPEEHQQGFQALAKLTIVIDALNTDSDGSVWTPDFTADELKYELWFIMGSPSGAGFSDGDCVGWHSDSYVGSRLVFRNRETALHAKEHFFDLFKSWMVLNP